MEFGLTSVNEVNSFPGEGSVLLQSNTNFLASPLCKVCSDVQFDCIADIIAEAVISISSLNIHAPSPSIYNRKKNILKTFDPFFSYYTSESRLKAFEQSIKKKVIKKKRNYPQICYN